MVADPAASATNMMLEAGRGKRCNTLECRKKAYLDCGTRRRGKIEKRRHRGSEKGSIEDVGRGSENVKRHKESENLKWSIEDVGRGIGKVKRRKEKHGGKRGRSTVTSEQRKS
jgi:hypothetical protein